VIRRVLLVEDVEDNRKLAGDLLRFGGWDVTEAVTGEAAIANAKTQAFDLVLMDLSLPGDLDGWGATRMIKAISQLPVIALTAHAMAGDSDRALAAGFDGYITKPIEVATFLSQIEEVVNRVRR
jgi:two-component system cell cycle response regulator DivK